VNQDNSTDHYVDNAIQTDICRSPDGNLNNTFVQNSCDDSTNASTSTNAQLIADGIAPDQVTIIDLAQEYAELYPQVNLLMMFHCYCLELIM
jgi:hypothetical protein